MKTYFDKQEDYAAFVREAWKESKIDQYKLAKKIGMSQPAVSHAVKKSAFSDTTKNGIRAQILDLLGFKVNNVFQVEKK